MPTVFYLPKNTEQLGSHKKSYIILKINIIYKIINYGQVEVKLLHIYQCDINHAFALNVTCITFNFKGHLCDVHSFQELYDRLNISLETPR